MTNHKTPLSQAFSSKPGSYGLAILVSDPIIDPGDRLQIEVYISGYGVIKVAKVAFYPSPSVFDYGESIVWHSLKTFHDGNKGWGADRVSLDPVGMVFCLSGEPVSDARPGERGNYQVSTEVKHPKGKSFLFLDLCLNRKARPGPQSIGFVFTYFDGDSWQTYTADAHFTVRDFYHRHMTAVWIFGALAALMSILVNSIKLWPCAKAFWQKILLLF